MTGIKNAVVGVARAIVNFGVVVQRNAKVIVFGVSSVLGSAVLQAQTDATAIATQALTAFGVIAPITITICAFYVILKIAKRVVH